MGKIKRLRLLSETLDSKIKRIERLVTGSESSQPLTVLRKLHTLRAEFQRVSSRRRFLNKALAWEVGSWLLDYAVQQEASVIYVEDLTTMRAEGLGAKQNTRVNEALRGQIFEALKYLARLEGVEVTQVPAADTSRLCPMCLNPLRHKTACGSMTSGRKWAYCPTCKYQGDRDHASAIRIGSRGLASQTIPEDETSNPVKKKEKSTKTVKDTEPVPAASGSTGPEVVVLVPRGYTDVKVRHTLTKAIRTRKTRKVIKIVKEGVTARRVVLRDKQQATPKRPHLRKERVTHILGFASVAVKRPTETSHSLAAPAARQAGSKEYSPHAYRLRMQHRGFKDRLKPSWVQPRPTPLMRSKA
jgi:IS605 OrfB family transposase